MATLVKGAQTDPFDPFDRAQSSARAIFWETTINRQTTITGPDTKEDNPVVVVFFDSLYITLYIIYKYFKNYPSA